MTTALRTPARTRPLAALLGALAGLALALVDVGSTLAYLQSILGGFEGLPRPTNLDWITGWAGTAESLTAVSGLLQLLTRLALLGLALLVFRTLNPEFRLVSPPPAGAEAGAVMRQPVNRRRLCQVGGAVLVSLWLLGYFALPGRRGWVALLAGPSGLVRLWPQAAAAASVVGLMLVLAGLWLVWGEAGFLRPAAGEAPRVRPARMLAAAALAGVALTPFALPLADWAQTIATEVLQGIGGAARDAWLTYMAGVLILYPLALGAAGWTAIALAQWTHFPRERRALAAGGLAAAAAWLGVAGLLHLAGAGRFDHGVPLDQAAGVSRGASGNLTTLTLLPGPQPVAGLTPLVSNQGLTATDDSAEQVWAYLERRRFRTVHLFPALMHVTQCEALSWNSDRLLETTLRSLERNPHPGICQILIEKLAHTAATPAARAALGRLQDPRWFHAPPGGHPGIKAIRQRLRTEGAEVRGRLFANGAPAERLRVGVVDEQLWQQFRGAPTALGQRLVVASSGVDATGGFRLRRVPAGRYLMVVGVPPLRRPWLPLGTRVLGSPGPITLRPGARRLDVGRIDLSVVRPRFRRMRPRGRA